MKLFKTALALSLASLITVSAHAEVSADSLTLEKANVLYSAATKDSQEFKAAEEFFNKLSDICTGNTVKDEISQVIAKHLCGLRYKSDNLVGLNIFNPWFDKLTLSDLQKLVENTSDNVADIVSDMTSSEKVITDKSSYLNELSTKLHELSNLYKKRSNIYEELYSLNSGYTQLLYSQNLFSKISFKANYDQVNNVVQLNIQNSLPDFDLKTITASIDYKNKNSGALVDQSFFTTDLSSIVERNGGTLLEEFGCGKKCVTALSDANNTVDIEIYKAVITDGNSDFEIDSGIEQEVTTGTPRRGTPRYYQNIINNDLPQLKKQILDKEAEISKLIYAKD